MLTIERRLEAIELRLRRLEAERLPAAVRKEKEAVLAYLVSQLTPQMHTNHPERFMELARQANAMELELGL